MTGAAAAAAGLAYREAGRGRPAVLVHGAASRGSVWAAQLAALAGVARVLVPDLPGHGASPGPGHPTVGGYAGALLRFLDAVGLDRAVLVGHSMGGAVVQTVALDRPDRVLALGLVATASRLRVLPRLLELLRDRPPEGVSLIEGLSYSPKTPAERVAEATRALREALPLVTLGDFLACDRFDVTARLTEIRAPALVLVGCDDRLTPPRQAAALAAGIPGARLREVADAGHYPQLEQPEAVSAALRGLLAEVEPAATPAGLAPG